MPEVEQVVLEVDEQPAVQGAAKANAAVASFGTAAERANERAARATETSGDRIIRTVDRSRQANERFISSLEKRVEAATKSPLERLLSERGRALERVAGDPRAVDRVTASFDKLITKQREVDRSSESLGRKISDFVRNPLQSAGNAVESFASGLGTIGGIALGAAAGIGLAAAAAFRFVAGAGQAAEQTVLLSQRVGLTVSQAERLQASAEIAGVQIGSLEASMRKLSVALEEGGEEGKKGREALHQLGVQATDSTGRLRSMYAIFQDIGKGLRNIQDPAERTRLAVRLLGRGALELTPLLMDMNELDATVRKLGVGVDEGLIRGLAKADDEVDKLAIAWRELKKELAGKIVGIVEIAVKLAEWTRATPRLNTLAGTAEAMQRDREGLRGPSAPTPPGADLAFTTIGTTLVEDFRRRRRERDLGLGELREKLTATKKERTEAEEALTTGLSADVARERISQVQKLITQEKGLEAAIKARTEAERKATEQAKLAEKGRETIRQIMGQREAGVFRVEPVKELDEAGRRSTEFAAAQMRRDQDFAAQTLEIRLGADREYWREQESLAERARESELRALEGVNARTVEDKIALEQKRLAIEENAIQRRLKLRTAELAAEVDAELAAMEIVSRARGIPEAQIVERTAALREIAATSQARMADEAGAQITEARENAAIRSANILRDHNMRMFDDLKRGFEGLFDAAFIRARSFTDALRDMFFTIFLTPVKNYLSNLFASMFTGMQTAGAGGAGGRGGIGSLLGMGFPALGGGVGYPGAPGGTPGFAGPVRGITTGGRGGFNLGGFGANLGNLREFVGAGQSVQLGPGMATTWQAASMGQKLSSIASSDAALMGGIALGAYGIKRGGWSGLGMTTASGALIGYRFGGPIGAAIGAGIGAVVGLFGLGRKSPEDKVIEKVKSLYQLRIDKQFAKQIVGIAQQSFGGTGTKALDAALASTQVKDLLALYAESTGQPFEHFAKQMRPTSLVQSGGSVYQAPAYSGGRALPTSGTIPSMWTGTAAIPPQGTVSPAVKAGEQIHAALKAFGEMGDRIGDKIAAQLNAIPLNVKLDGPATTTLLRGEAVQTMADNPRAVQAATVKATKSNAGRREMLALQLSPGTLVS